MRSRIVSLVSVLVVVAMAGSALVYADAELEKRYRGLATSQMPAPETGPFDFPVVTDGTAGGFDPVAQSDDITVWERENRFLMRHNMLRQGWGPLLDRPVEPAGQHVRVLAVGDSYVWGQGAEDLDALWPRQLEERLNQGGGPLFRVTRLGRLPSSFMQAADWLDAERLQRLQPDVIVVGYLRNDFYPTFEEESLCRSYATCTGEGEAPVVWNPRNGNLMACIEGDDSLLSAVIRRIVNPVLPYVGHWLTNRYCDPDRVANDSPGMTDGIWIKFPEESPYWDLFTEAVERLRDNAGDVPVLVYDYDNNLKNPLYPGQTAVLRAFLKAGFRVVEPAAANPILLKYGSDAMGINPSDRHPGPRLSRAFAEDLASEIREVLDLTATVTDGRSAPPVSGRGGLVSNHLPATLQVTDGPGSAVIRAAPLSERYVRDNDLRRALDGTWGALQEVPCARMGRPHLRVMFDVATTSGSELEVTLVGAEDAMVLQSIGYDETGGEVRGQPTLLTPQRSVTLRSGPTVRGFLLGTRSSGCPATDIRTPRVELRIERAPGGPAARVEN